MAGLLAAFALTCWSKNRVLVEIKAGGSLLAAHEAQLLNYLKATGVKLGLLLNFGPRAEFRRRVFS